MSRAGAPSLRTHLVLVVLGILVPGTLLTGLLVWRTVTESRDLVEQRLVDSARVDADALDRQFDDVANALRTLASSPALAADDLRAFHAEARRAADAQPGWFAVVLVTPEGRQLVQTSVPFGIMPGVTALDPGSLQEILRTKATVVGRLITPWPDSKPLFAIRIPVERDGHIVYALTAVLKPELLQRLIASPLSSEEERARALIDPNFTIAARNRENERFAGTVASTEAIAQFSASDSTFFRIANREAIELYVASRRSKYGWFSTVAVPAALIDAPARASVAWLVGGGTLLMVVGIFGALVVSRRLSKDLASASDVASALAEGRHPPRVVARVAEGQELHDSLEAAGHLLQVRERAKDEFLAVLGHELRNPLAPATTALELMKLKGPTVMQREREVLERQVLHLTRLVDDLLDVSRLTSGKIELRVHRFELRAAVDRAIDMAQPLIRQHRHSLDVDVPEQGLLLDADEDRIVQILVNLLTNAAKYTPAGGHLRLAARADDSLVSIVCEDDGPGVPAELLPTIFDAFVQGPRAIDRREGGLGLGLALARNLATLHGGTLTLEHVQPHGSRFIVGLPMARPAAAPLDEGGDAPALPFRTRRVLLVDDNEDAREMLKIALEGTGHEVRIAASGEAAISMSAVETMDAAVLDIGLPGMNGYEVAERLRAINPGLRLIALTGYGQPADAEATRRAGFHAHCTKPVTVSTLLKQIEGPAGVTGAAL